MNEKLHLDEISTVVERNSSDLTYIRKTVSSVLTEIENTNRLTNSVIWTDNTYVENQIETLTEKAQSGKRFPLLGVPILVKEIEGCIKGTENSWGNSQLKKKVYKDSFTSNSVQNLISAGAIIVGKTNNPELGLTVTTKSKAHGPCNNPLDLQRNSGGSSGGSASAVASGIVSIATASDGGGSTRIPAANCGVFGFKPTNTNIDLGPGIDQAWAGLVSKGIISSNVEDLISVYNCISANTVSIIEDTNKYRIAYSNTGFADMYEVNLHFKEAVENIAKHLESVGYEIENKTPKPFLDYSIVQPFLDVISFNTLQDCKEIERRLSGSFDISQCEVETQYFYENGLSVSQDVYKETLGLISTYGKDLAQFFDTFDFLITPTTGDIAPLHGQVESDPENAPFIYSGLCFPSNIAKCPSISIPVKCGHPTGLPCGIQIISKPGNDESLLNLARTIERDYSDIFITKFRNITS